MPTHRHLTAPLVLIALLAALAVPAVYSTAYAQDSNPNPAIMICVTGAGCWHSDISGELSSEQTTTLIGENDSTGNNVVCTVDAGCEWTALEPNDLDLAYEGDGEADGEKQPAPELPDDSDKMFPALDVEDATVTPVEGTWVAYNLAGAMVCPGVMTFDIPASPPQTGQLIVEDDGAVLTLESNDPELGVVPMMRTQDGVYHGTLEMEVEGQTLTINYDEMFVEPTMAVGMIHGEMTAQGYECTILRPFYTTIEGLELLERPVEDENVPDESMDDMEDTEDDTEDDVSSD